MPADNVVQAPLNLVERQHCLWESPDRSIVIYLAFDVIDAINVALAQAAALPLRGAEVGGLLLGRADLRSRTKIWIDAFEPVPCAYDRGPSWVVRAAEYETLRANIAEREAGEEAPQVVGFYRSHTRKGLFLSDDDDAMCRNCFSSPANAFLLIKSFTTRANIGGFFFWEGASMRRDASYREFPFHRRELGGGEPRLLTPPAPAPVAPPPMLHELEHALPEPVEAEEYEPAALDGPRSLLKWPLVGIAILAGIIIAAYLYYRAADGRASFQGLQRGPVEPYAVALGLTAAESAGQIVVRWNRRNPFVALASRGVFSIHDGGFRKDIEMTGEQLRHGSLVYSRLTETVQFRLEVFTGPKNSTSELLDFVSSAPLKATAVSPTERSPRPVRVAVPKKRAPARAAKARRVATPAPPPANQAASPANTAAAPDAATEPTLPEIKRPPARR